jgi:hypothetical protein
VAILRIISPGAVLIEVAADISNALGQIRILMSHQGGSFVGELVPGVFGGQRHDLGLSGGGGNVDIIAGFQVQLSIGSVH